MALPLVVAPIFAIYSHRHTLTEQTTVDIQYKYQSNEVNSIDDIVVGNIYYYEFIYIEHRVIDSTSLSFLSFVQCSSIDGDHFNDRYTDEIIASNFDVRNSDNVFYVEFSNYDSGLESYCYFTSLDFYTSVIYDYSNYIAFYDTVFIANAGFIDYLNYVSTHQNQWFDEVGLPQYADFTVIDSVTVNDSSSDIMSVFVNNYAEAINKYFNYDNAFNFGGLYTWLNTNFFSGNAPLGFFIFWHLLIYWLLTSLLWLIFDVLMYVPMLVHRWLDKASLS